MKHLERSNLLATQRAALEALGRWRTTAAAAASCACAWCGRCGPVLRLYSGSIKTLFRLYSGSIQALLRLYSGSIQALLRLYSGSIKGSIETLFRLYSGSMDSGALALLPPAPVPKAGAAAAGLY